jgi:hypothetical protein
MSHSTVLNAAANESPEPQTREVATPRKRPGDGVVYLLLIGLTIAAWQFTRLGLFKSGDDVGYWLGVVGGVMLLLLFTYPLRKHIRFMHRLGRVKWWFLVHITLGIGGPILILVHSTFHLSSVNATVALLSMLVVALSGVVGRFIYVRIHSGLHGERSKLNELQARAGLSAGEMKSRFRFAPEVAEKLLAFEAEAISGDDTLATVWRKVVILPIRQRRVYRECVVQLNDRLKAVGRDRAWSREYLRSRRRKAASLTRRHLQSIVRVAQFTAYERLFALWHVAHVPFVYILIFSAIFHVYAVHAY